MTFDVEEGIYMLPSGQSLPIYELTNAEIRQAIEDLDSLTVDSDGENDEFVALLRRELSNRNLDTSISSNET